MHVRAGMDAQLLVRRRGAHEGLGIAAQVQGHAGPISDREHRHGDPVPLRLRAAKGAAVEAVAEPEMQRVRLPGIGLVPRGAADEMVHHVRHEPVRHEQAEQPAVEQRVPVEVGETFPWDDGLERRRLVVGDEPLVDREIGDAGEPDRAVAPGLRRRPFDRVVEIDRFRERPRLALPRRLTAAAPVDPHGGIALRHPPLRIHGLPVHQRVGLLLERVRRDPELVLLVGAEIEDRGKASAVVGTKHVGLEPGAVAHRHVDVLLDEDAVDRHGRRRLHFHRCPPLCAPLAVAPLSPAARPSPLR